MIEEKEAKIRKIVIEWDDGVSEVVYTHRGVSSITIDTRTKKKRGAMP